MTQPRDTIHQFYFAGGKPLTKEDKLANESALQQGFEGKNEVTLDDFDQLCIDVLKIPKIFKKLAFDRIL